MGDARPDPATPDPRRPSWLEPGKKPARSRNPLPWISALLAISLVAVAAFLLGRGSGPRMIPPPVVPLPTATNADPVPELRAPVPRTVTQAPVEAPALARAAQELDPPEVPGPKAEQLRAAGQIAAERRREAAQQEKLAEQTAKGRPPPPPPPPPFPRFGPPGQVVQLGTYVTSAQAETAAALFRVRYRGLLATLPKSVSPYRAPGASRPVYRVQFLTPSTVYADVTCQRLRAAKKSCIVVY